MYLIHVIFQLIADKQPVNPWMKHFKRNYISKKWNQLTSFIHSTSIHLSPSTENDICHTEWLNRIQWIPITIPIMIHIDLRFHKNMSHIKLQLSTREIVNYSIRISIIACMWQFESQIFLEYLILCLRTRLISKFSSWYNLFPKVQKRRGKQKCMSCSVMADIPGPSYFFPLFGGEIQLMRFLTASHQRLK